MRGCHSAPSRNRPLIIAIGYYFITEYKQYQFDKKVAFLRNCDRLADRTRTVDPAKMASYEIKSLKNKLEDCQNYTLTGKMP